MPKELLYVLIDCTQNLSFLFLFFSNLVDGNIAVYVHMHKLGFIDKNEFAFRIKLSFSASLRNIERYLSVCDRIIK